MATGGFSTHLPQRKAEVGSGRPPCAGGESGASLSMCAAGALGFGYPADLGEAAGALAGASGRADPRGMAVWGFVVPCVRGVSAAAPGFAGPVHRGARVGAWARAGGCPHLYPPRSPARAGPGQRTSRANPRRAANSAPRRNCKGLRLWCGLCGSRPGRSSDGHPGPTLNRVAFSDARALGHFRPCEFSHPQGSRLIRGSGAAPRLAARGRPPRSALRLAAIVRRVVAAARAHGRVRPPRSRRC